MSFEASKRVEPTTEQLQVTAEGIGVCIRPLLRKLIDTETGVERTVSLPCGSTRESVCKPCADKARRLRIQQCREGWHRATEISDPAADVPDLTGLDLPTAENVIAQVVTLTHPHAGPLPARSFGVEVTAEQSHETAAPGAVVGQFPRPGAPMRPGRVVRLTVSSGPADGHEDEGMSVSRRRTTRRREDAPALPTVPMDERRTIGRQITSPSGNTYRPSMFLTLTLPSYGPVNSDGTPQDPDDYEYRRAAADAMHFSAAVDRFWQNLRRCAGFKLQYFAAVEPQQRLALHLHAAVRGVVSERVFRKVVAATYHQVWWPHHGDNDIVYDHGDKLPVWSESAGGYVDPTDGAPLASWDEAMDDLDTEDAKPAHVVWFGTQLDHQWFLPESPRTDKRIGYLTKYLTKSIAETYDPDRISKTRRAHLDRLHQETRYLPCSPECANWLRYAIQPRDAEPDMIPGRCPARAHQVENLGHGGRRVLVSRQWSGKRLDEHKTDRAAVVRQALNDAGIEMPEADRCSATATGTDGQPRYIWEPVDTDTRDDLTTYREILRANIRERIRWRTQYDAVKLRDGPEHDRSANQPAASTTA